MQMLKMSRKGFLVQQERRRRDGEGGAAKAFDKCGACPERDENI